MKYLSLLLLFFFGLGDAFPQERPNIVLIMADDLGWKDLNCYGNQVVETPALNRLAKEGIRFTAAYSASPVCTPTRAALMTGESPARLHITNHASGHKLNFQKPGTRLVTPDWQRHLPLERVTLAEQLKEAGYATGFVGKWHLSHRPRNSGPPTEEQLRPEHQGFDLNIGGCDFGGPPSYFAPYRIPGLEANADGEYLADRCADECVDFIKSNQKQPFFLCWWNYNVHYPFEAPKDLIQKYEGKDGVGNENPTYSAMIEGMDRSIDKLLKSIDELGLAKNTLIIFTSDNGPFAANVKPLRAEKGYVYEGGIRVPLIVKWDGMIEAGRQSNEPVVTMDLHASILDVCGIKPHPSNTPDGVSIKNYLIGTVDQIERKALCFHYPNYAFHKKNRMGSAIRERKLKLIKFYDDDGESYELYDLANDISESNNLTEERPDDFKRLKSDLNAWLESVNAQLPSRSEKTSEQK